MSSDRVVLRADVFQGSRHVIGHTIGLTARDCIVRTDERLDLEARVRLRLSFPRLFAPLEIDATIESRDLGSGHGYYASYTLVFAQESERVRNLLAAQPHGAPPTYRLLVVEDSAVMRDIVQHGATRFESVHMQTDTTDTVEEAKRLVESKTYDLALVDLYLPGDATGADLVRDLRSRGDDLPVIGFSIGGPTARRTFIDAGADLFLDKPVVLRDVFATIERLSLAARRAE